MPSLKKTVSILLLQAGVILFAALIYFAWDADKLYELLNGDVVFTPSEQPCELHDAPCLATLPDGTELSFSITPRPVTAMQTLTLTVEAKGLDAQKLRVDIYGTEMNMGRYTYTLEKSKEGLYTGHGMIPSCVPNMEWRSDVIIEEPGRRYGTYFTFTTR